MVLLKQFALLCLLSIGVISTAQAGGRGGNQLDVLLVPDSDVFHQYYKITKVNVRQTCKRGGQNDSHNDNYAVIEGEYYAKIDNTETCRKTGVMKRRYLNKYEPKITVKNRVTGKTTDLTFGRKGATHSASAAIVLEMDDETVAVAATSGRDGDIIKKSNWSYLG